MSGTSSSLNHAQKGNFAQGGLFDGGFTVVNDSMESWAKEGNQERMAACYSRHLAVQTDGFLRSIWNQSRISFFLLSLSYNLHTEKSLMLSI